MITNILTAILLLLSSGKQAANLASSVPQEVILGQRQFSLGDRYHVPSVNEVMKKNILLNLAYLEGTVTKKSDINWDTVEAPSTYEFTLKPGKAFAFHNS